MTKVILIGTGTPNPDPYRMGPSVLVQYNQSVYLFDVGVNVVRRLNEAALKHNFSIQDVKDCFITHLHSDHTLGLSDLMITPWILGRNDTITFYGPKGLRNMVKHLKKAYQVDIYKRIDGPEQANQTGISFIVEEIKSGIIYDQEVTIEAIPVNHLGFESFAYKITTPDKTIVISGDTAPCDALIEKASGCDILVHEVYYAAGLQTRSKTWQNYHSTAHTSGIELGKIAEKVQPKKLVLYHQLFMQEHILSEDMQKNDALYQEKIIDEIALNFTGNIIYGKDLLMIE